MAIGSSYLSAPITVKGTSVFSPSTIMSFTLPSAGTWDVEYFVTMTTNGGSQAPGFAAVYDSSGTILQNSEISGSRGMNQVITTASGRYFITTTGLATYTIKGWNSGAGLTYLANSSATGRTGVVYTNFASSGIQGVVGPQGPQGVKGNTGDVGLRGPQGEVGLRGPKGDTGATGATGNAGTAGTAATITVGTVTTGAVGSNATVTNSGTSSSAVLNFTIPGGVAGATGNVGPAGTSATVTIGTVRTGTPGTSAIVSNSGNNTAAVLNFTIPTGSQGPQGVQGERGLQGNVGATGNVGPTGANGTSVNVTVSNASPTGGNIGDIWVQTL